MAADTETLAGKCDALSADAIEQKRRELAPHKPIFLYVGRLIRLKGLRELLAGWEMYTRGGGEGTLVLVGEGPERDALEQFIREKNVPRVIFAGRADYEQIALFYAAADALIMPTLEDNWSLSSPKRWRAGSRFSARNSTAAGRSWCSRA